MNIMEKIAGIIGKLSPTFKFFFTTEIVPRIKQRAYEALNSYADSRIEDLASLAVKFKNAEDPAKREAHRKGLETGIEVLRLIANKLLEACNEIEKEIK